MAPTASRFDPISRSGICGPVPTLKSLASQVVSSHIAGLSDIGDVPYTLAAPFLAQCSAVQLGDIELRSPHIRRESRELWKAHTLRDFFEVRIPYEKKELKEPRNWRKVYITAHEARQQKEADGRARLKDSYKALEDKRQERKLVYDPRIRGEPKKQSSSGWGSSTASRSPSNSIMSKVRGQTSHYAKTFKTPVSRPPPKRFPLAGDGPPPAASSSRPAPSGIRAALALVPPRASTSGHPSATLLPSSVATTTYRPTAPTGQAKSVSTTWKGAESTVAALSSASASCSSTSALQALPPPLSYRAPSSAPVLPGGSSFVDMKSRPIDPSERFVISSARSRATEKERLVPRGTFIPAASRDEGTPRTAAVNFFGKGASTSARPPSKDVVKVITKSVVTGGPPASSRSTPRAAQQASPPTKALPTTKPTGPGHAFPDDLPLPTSVAPVQPPSAGDGRRLSAADMITADGPSGAAPSPSLPKRKESTMFIPAKRKKTVH